MINNRNRTTRRQSAKRATLVGEKRVIEPIHKDLQNLMEIQRTQEIRFMPEQKDVPRLRFNQNVIYNVELSYLGSISTSTTVATTGAIVTQLSNASSASSYTTLFDRYRIIQVNVKFIQNATTGMAGPLYTVLDYDDGNAPTGVATLLNYGTLKITPNGVIDERTFTPRIATAAYSGSFTSYANLGPMTWIDSASPGVDYFGVKYAVPVTSLSYAISYVVTMMVQFKSQRAT